MNDGSTDGSQQILDSYHEKCANVKNIQIKNNGVSNARNIGILSALGDYIWMVDSDDFIARNVLADLRNMVYKTSPDIVDFGAYTFNEELSVSEITAYSKNQLLPTSFANHVYITRSLFRRVFLNNNKIRFDPNIAYSEDSLFKCECLICKPCISCLNNAYYFFRFRSGSSISLSTKTANEKKLSSWLAAAIKFLGYYQDCDSDTSAIKGILADLLMSNLWAVLSMVAKMPPDEAKMHLKKLKENHLFPFNRPKECTLKRSYQTTRTDIIGKIFDKVYISTHRPWGFRAMCGLQKLIALKHRVK